MGIYKEYILTCHDCNITFAMYKHRADVRKFEGEIWNIIHGGHNWEAQEKVTHIEGLSFNTKIIDEATKIKESNGD